MKSGGQQAAHLQLLSEVTNPFFPLINIIGFPICVGFKSQMLPNGCFCFTLRQQILCHHLAGQLAVLSSG